jgi:hypothetical protein
LGAILFEENLLPWSSFSEISDDTRLYIKQLWLALLLMAVLLLSSLIYFRRKLSQFSSSVASVASSTHIGASSSSLSPSASIAIGSHHEMVSLLGNGQQREHCV